MSEPMDCFPTPEEEHESIMAKEYQEILESEASKMNQPKQTEPPDIPLDGLISNAKDVVQNMDYSRKVCKNRPFDERDYLAATATLAALRELKERREDEKDMISKAIDFIKDGNKSLQSLRDLAENINENTD